MGVLLRLVARARCWRSPPAWPAAGVGCAARPGERRARIVSLVPARHRDAVRDRRRTAGGGGQQLRRVSAGGRDAAARRRAARSRHRADPVAAAGPRDHLRIADRSAGAVQARRHPHLRLPARRPRRHPRHDRARLARATGHRRRRRNGGRRPCAPGSTRIRAPGRGRGQAAHAARHLDASRARCAGSTPAAASASCTTCWSWPAARNVFADVARRVGAAVAGDAARPGGRTSSSSCTPTVECAATWPRRSASGRRWPSMPAVRSNRVHFLAGAYLVVAGPAPRRRRRDDRARLAPGSVQVKILLSWSSGKDSAWALHVLQQQHPGAVAALLTTINEAVRARGHARRPARRARGAGPGRGSAASHRADSRIRARTTITRRGCGVAVAGGRGRGIHARRVRRSVSRRRPPLPRDAARRHRADAAVSAVGDADAAAGART